MHTNQGLINLIKMAAIYGQAVSLLLLVVVVYGSGVTEESCETIKHTNGCSTPLWLPMPYKKDFEAACNKHDVCYHCVS